MYKKEKSKRLSEKNLIAFLILLKTILLLNLPKELAFFLLHFDGYKFVKTVIN